MKSFLVILANMIFLTGCAANPVDKMNTDRDAVTIINRYVSEHKGWHPNQYRIEFAEHIREGTIFLIVNLEDEKKAIPGGGLSFEVIYDPLTKRIVREIGLQ